MPKTKSLYTKGKSFLISDKGNQMLANLCRLSESDSEASFIRDAIIFYMNNAMNPKIAEFWNKQDVPEINDFGKSNKYVEIQQAKKDIQTILDTLWKIRDNDKFYFKTYGEQMINDFIKNLIS